MVEDLATEFKEYLESTLLPGSVRIEEGSVLRFINSTYGSNFKSLNDVKPGVRSKYIVAALFIITFDRERRPSFDASVVSRK